MNFGSTQNSFEQVVNNAPTGVLLAGIYESGNTYLVIGYTLGNYASFISFTYNNDNAPKKLCYKYGGTWTWI